MHKLTQLALSLSFAGLVLTLPATTSAQSQKESTQASAKVQQKASFLFVLRAEKGTITIPKKLQNAMFLRAENCH